MPNSVTIRRARLVARSMSSEAPVVISFVDQLLSGATAHQHRHRRHQLGAAVVVLVLGRQLQGPSERPAPRDDRHLVDRVGERQHVADDRVAALVVGDALLLLGAHHPGLALRSGDDPVDGLFHLAHRDLLVAVAGGEQGGLVHQVGQVGAGEAGRSTGQDVEIDADRRPACPWRGRARMARRPTRSGGRRRSGGRTGPGAAGPGRGCRAGWWRRSGSRRS